MQGEAKNYDVAMVELMVWNWKWHVIWAHYELFPDGIL